MKPTLMVYVKIWEGEMYCRHDAERHDFKSLSQARTFAGNFGYSGIQCECKTGQAGLKPRVDALAGGKGIESKPPSGKLREKYEKYVRLCSKLGLSPLDKETWTKKRKEAKSNG